jgi:DNA mismatch repair protein MutS
MSNFYQQYLSVKNKHRNAIVFYRLGDFYEVLGDDAKTASRVLDLTLTGRDCGNGRIPMCGVPHHTLEKYILKLIQHGYKVAVAEV